MFLLSVFDSFPPFRSCSMESTAVAAPAAPASSALVTSTPSTAAPALSAVCPRRILCFRLLTVLSFHCRFSHLCKQQEEADLKKQCNEAYKLMWRPAEEDKRQAFEILRKVVDRGYGFAQQLADGNGEPPQCWLAYCYEEGIGVPKNLSEALRLYSEGATQGEKFSSVAVGFLPYFLIAS